MGGGGLGGGEYTMHVPSSRVASLLKLFAAADMQPAIGYTQQPSVHAMLASLAKFLAVVSMHPVIA